MTDQELVELFWQRREEALTGLQDKYGGWCRSIAGRILGEERDVEECLGDCWLQPVSYTHLAGAGFGVDTNVLTLITADGAEELPLMSKEEAAGTILDRALAMAGC